MDWHKLHDLVIPYVVRVETPEGYGTGFLFAYNQSKSLAAIATAAHVVNHAHDWRQPIKVVHHESGQEIFLTHGDRVIFLDAARDSASILIKGNALKLPESVLPLMDSSKVIRVGVEVAWIGFPSVAHPELCFFKGAVSAFLIDKDCYLIDGVAINGVSGGPVFSNYVDGAGNTSLTLIGSISAYVSNRVGGATLPGLLRAQDISPFQETVRTIKSLDEGRKKEEEAAKAADQAPSTDASKPTEIEPTVP